MYVAEMEYTTELGTIHAAFLCIYTRTSVQWSAEGANQRQYNATNMFDRYSFFYPDSNQNLTGNAGETFRYPLS